MENMNIAIKAAFDYLDKQGEHIPADVWQAAVKARSGLSACMMIVFS